MRSQTLLGTIGAIDIMTAFGFLLPQIPMPALVWTTMWGTVTALSRIYFLWSFSGPMWSERIHPIAEFLVRVPNGLIPIILILIVRPHLLEKNLRDSLFSSWALIAVVAQVLGLFLNYLSKWYDPFYPYEIEKFNKPLWYFHTNGLLASLSLAVFAIYFWPQSSPGTRRCATILATCAYAMLEVFDILIINAPLGFWLTVIRIAEHVPIYVAIIVSFQACTSADSNKPCFSSR